MTYTSAVRTLIFSDGFNNPHGCAWAGAAHRLQALNSLTNACLYLIDAPIVDVAAMKILRKCQRKVAIDILSHKTPLPLDAPLQEPGALIGGYGD
jgi:hypothetical protein